MKLLHYFFVTISLIIILGITNCISSKKTDKDAKIEKEIPIIDLANAIETSGKPLNLSDFVEYIEYIRPEYPATLVDVIFGISVNDDYLLLQIRDRLLCYTPEGKFIREIGRKVQKSIWVSALMRYTMTLLLLTAITIVKFYGIISMEII